MTLDTSGPVWPEPLAHYDPDSSCWKMSGGMFPSDSMPSLATLPAWGMTHAGELFEHPMPELPTVEPASSFLPTPRATDGTKGGPNQRGSKGDLMLPSAVMLLPTPKTTDAKGHSPADAKRNEPGLRAVEYLLPTPRAQDEYERSNWKTVERAAKGEAQDTLVRRVRWEWCGPPSSAARAKLIGASTPPPSPDGPESSDAPPPPQLSLDETATPD